MNNYNNKEIPKILLIVEAEEEIFRQLKDPEHEGFRMLKPWATELERLKYKMCDWIVDFKNDNKLDDEEIIRRLELDSIKLKEIYNHRYDKLNFEELFSYAERLAVSKKSKLVAYFHIVMIPLKNKSIITKIN